jgi:polysaccharide biosynthesis transport protein
MNDNLQPAAFHQINQTKFLFPAPPPNRFSAAVKLRDQLHRYGTALRKRWWVLLLTFLLVGGPAVYYAANRPPSFRSDAILWLATKLNLPNGGFYPDDLASYIGTQAQIIKSATIQSRAIEKVRARFPSLAATKQNAASGDLPFDLAVRTLPKSLVVELRAVGPTAEATPAFLNAVMDEYLSFKDNSRHRTSSGALSRITGQINDVQKQLQQQENQLTQFQMSNNVSYLTEHGVSAGSHLSKLGEILSDLKTEDRLLELLTPAQFKDMAEEAEAPSAEGAVPGEKVFRAQAINTSPPQTAYYQALQQIDLLKAKRDEFSQVLRPTHSKMVKLNLEIAGLEQMLKTLQNEGEQRALTQMVDRRKSLELQIQNIESQYRTWETNATEASQKLAEYDRMKQDMQRSQALYDRLLGLLQTVDLNNDLDSELLVPMAPASQARPTLAKSSAVAASLLLAFLAAVGAFLVVEFMDDRFNSMSELDLHMPAEAVVQIPETCLSPQN